MLETLVTVPPRMATYLNGPEGAARRQRLAWGPGDGVFVTSDPAGIQLGSGGGTVHLLWQAWQASGAPDLDTWLQTSRKLVIHAGGQSRRLPAYAAVGKTFVPIPLLPDLQAQRHDQMLCDVQIPTYGQVLQEAGAKPAVMISSGDVWLEFNPFQLAPVQADICGLGMRVSPEMAAHFGVFFTPRTARSQGEAPIAQFLQKPTPATIVAHQKDYDFYVDTGMWLLSPRAVRFLFEACGWDGSAQHFATEGGLPAFLDLYSEVGPALGRSQGDVGARFAAAGFGELSVSVMPLDDARFLHLGSNRQLFETLEQLQRGSERVRRHHSIASTVTVHAEASRPTWVEGCLASADLALGGYNIVTGLPEAAAIAALREYQCLDLIPVGDDGYCLRPYHLDDALRGRLDSDAAFCGTGIAAWLAARGLTPDAPAQDLIDFAAYPILAAADLSQAWLDWFFAAAPDPAIAARWRAAKRLSAKALADAVNYERYHALRQLGETRSLAAFFRQRVAALDYGEALSQDFAALAKTVPLAEEDLAAYIAANTPAILANLPNPVHRARFHMFLSQLARASAVVPTATAPASDAATASSELTATHRASAFRELRQSIVHGIDIKPVAPVLGLKSDQVVWARSPVRLDLAGGWTDTPPYCLERGGTVLNLAVMLNGQPPVQAIIRPLDEPELRLHSIDLGTQERLRTWDDLRAYNDARAAFSLPKAALALAGFLPEFHSGQQYASLADQLTGMGGGLEISTLSAIPKGSGLGTSSILAATILAGLSRACRLDWLEIDVYHRVMAIEQLLTTGGGWQDQAGALWRGVKLIQTQPGASQHPVVRFLPEHLLGPDVANRRFLLYYTGITRLARDILQEIVRNMFLARRETLAVLDLIRLNANQVYHAILTGDEDGLVRAIGRAWELNKRLDPDTTNPQIEALLALCGDDMAACKLLGAGGGGYMLICAHSRDAGARIRERLEANPPNPRARFVDFEIAQTGTQVTVS